MGNLQKPKVLFIVGATGAGKSDLAIELAKIFNGEIISADSVQIYKGFDIGSAKIKKEQMQNIKHYGIDIKSPEEEFTVYDYVEYTKSCINEITKKGKLPIIVGGTGLYCKALIEGYNFGDTNKHSEFRKSLEAEIEYNGLQSVYDKLYQLNSELAKSIDKHNSVRVIRAMEIVTFGKERTKNSNSQYNFVVLAVTLDRDTLYKKINQRVDTMLEQGLIHEVENLYKKYGKDVQPMKAIGYKEVISYLKGEISKNDMIELIKQHTRNYAKRQLTFIKGLKDVKYINNTNKNEALSCAIKEIKKWN